MRPHHAAAFALIALVGTPLAARADLGPPPQCAPGTHSEYLYGRHCVHDGFHLEAGDGGGVREVQDLPSLVPSASVAPGPTTSTTSGTTSTTKSAAPTPAPNPAPPKSGCSYGTATSFGVDGAMLLAALSLMAARHVMARRRSRG